MSSKKVLFTSHTANFSKFNRPFMRWFKEQGFEVHYASAGEERVLDCDKHFAIPFSRNPFNLSNVKAFHQLKKILVQNNYDVVHTHTPVGGVITRLAAKTIRKNGTKVIYTAHGFHFFKGAPLLNWLTFYPIEKLMAKYTDALVTINKEDYERARSFSTNVFYIPGVGVDLTNFKPSSRSEKRRLRKLHGFSDQDFILIYAAELNRNKNQAFLIKQMKTITEEIPNAKLLLCGTGKLHDTYARMIDVLDLSGKVILLGYRNDMSDLFKLADIGVASSIREGLGLNLIEAMATGLPIVASNNRGHRDLVNHGQEGFLYKTNDPIEFTKYVYLLHNNPKSITHMRRQNSKSIKHYSIQKIIEAMAKVYTPTLDPNIFDISVVIPAYNASRTITRALDSVLNQTLPGPIKEIVIVNDGSTDNTAEIIKKYVQEHPHTIVIKLITTRNMGASHARNLGIEAAKGHWIGLLDSDDYWSSRKIERQVDAILSNPEIKFIGTRSQDDSMPAGKKIGKNLYRTTLKGYLFKTYPSTCSILFDKSVLRDTGYFDVTQNYAEDANLFMRIIANYNCYFIAEPLLFLDDKPTFGHSGLSSNLRGMHEGCIKNIQDAHRLGLITRSMKDILTAWEKVKYVRRITLTRLRAMITRRTSTHVG